MSGRRYGTDTLAALVRHHGDETVRAAVDLYVDAGGGSCGDPTVQDYLALLADHDPRTLRPAVGLYAAAGGVGRGGPSVEHCLHLLADHDSKAVQVAIGFVTSNGGSHRGQLALGDLIAAIEAAITQDP